MLKINIKQEVKNLILLIIRDLFLVLFFLLIAFSAMEAVKPRLVTNYISLELFFAAILVLGIITMAYYQPTHREPKKLRFWDYLAIILFSVLAGIFIVYLTRPLGWLAILVGLAAAIICYYFITLCYQE